MSPFFSIITATYNAASALPRLLESLASQTYRDFELVIQDGDSLDATLSVVRSYAERLPAVTLASEPDSGIYDAWNKAVARACGKWLVFLGADDWFIEPNTLQQVKERLCSVSEACTLAAAHLEWHRANSVHMFKPVMEGFARDFSTAPAPFPSLFVRRELAVANPFDTRFRIAGDYDFLCRTWLKACPAELNICAVGMGYGGVSADPRNWLRSDYEMFLAARRNLPRSAPWPKRLIPAAKTCILSTVFRLMGFRRGAFVLDKIRVLRGLSPGWMEQIQSFLDK